jgi:hypothetical protein
MWNEPVGPGCRRYMKGVTRGHYRRIDQRAKVRGTCACATPIGFVPGMARSEPIELQPLPAGTPECAV